MKNPFIEMLAVAIIFLICIICIGYTQMILATIV